MLSSSPLGRYPLACSSSLASREPGSPLCCAASRVIWSKRAAACFGALRSCRSTNGSARLAGLVSPTPRHELRHSSPRCRPACRSSSATVVVVDEAQRLESGELGILFDLAEAGRRSGRPLAVLLVGLPELDVKLARLVGNKAGRASTLHARLSRLETPEVRAYMAYRLERVGLSLDRLFQAEAVERVAAYAEGIPRVINHLCSGALRGARESGLTMVSAPTVDAAAHWLDLPPPAGALLMGAWRGPRRRLRLWAARGVLSGRRTMRAWSPGMGLAALGRAIPGRGAGRAAGSGSGRPAASCPGAERCARGRRGWASRLSAARSRGVARAAPPAPALGGPWRPVRAPNDARVVAGDGPRGSRPRGPGAWRGPRRRLRLWAARGVLSGRRTMRAWSPGMGLAALGRAVPGAWRGPRRWLRLWAARGVLSGRRTMRAWSPGMGLAALGRAVPGRGAGRAAGPALGGSRRPVRAPNDARVVAGDGPRGPRSGSNRGVLCAPTDATTAVVASAAGGTSARQAVEAAPARARSRRVDSPRQGPRR